MRRPTFVPQPDLLENRLALSGGPKFTASGAAILTSHALSETYSDVQHAFVQFARHGQNYQALEVNLAVAVSRIPWNKRDGLLSTVEGEVSGLQANISSGVSRPVITSLQSTLGDVQSFVQSEVADGVIAVR